MLKLTKLSDKSDYIVRTVDETFDCAKKDLLPSDQALVITWSEERNLYSYQYSGNQDNKTLLWHVEQFKAAILEGRLNE